MSNSTTCPHHDPDECAHCARIEALEEAAEYMRRLGWGEAVCRDIRELIAKEKAS